MDAKDRASAGRISCAQRRHVAPSDANLSRDCYFHASECSISHGTSAA